jgi:Tol biopolymer transport system component
MQKFTLLSLLTILSIHAVSQYPGRQIPTVKPALFAEGMISDGMSNRDFTISPQGNEIFYTIQQKDFMVSAIVRLYKKNGSWGKPEVASFSGRYNDLEASFSPDGNRIYFSSNRPSSAADTVNDFDIWFVNKTTAGWSEPVHAGFIINSNANEFYPSAARNGNVYFTSEFKEGKGKEDIVMCEWKNGNYLAPVSLPEAINSKGYEFNAYVDPDEQFVVFTAYGRADDMGKGDLYISKKDSKGNWLPARNLGPEINSKYLDYCPFVSPDKKYFFFSTNRPLYKTPFEQKKDYQHISSMLNGAGNGLDDIYWMETFEKPGFKTSQ